MKGKDFALERLVRRVDQREGEHIHNEQHSPMALKPYKIGF